MASYSVKIGGTGTYDVKLYILTNPTDVLSAGTAIGTVSSLAGGNFAVFNNLSGSGWYGIGVKLHADSVYVQQTEKWGFWIQCDEPITHNSSLVAANITGITVKEFADCYQVFFDNSNGMKDRFVYEAHYCFCTSNGHTGWTLLNGVPIMSMTNPSTHDALVLANPTIFNHKEKITSTGGIIRKTARLASAVSGDFTDCIYGRYLYLTIFAKSISGTYYMPALPTTVKQQNQQYTSYEIAITSAGTDIPAAVARVSVLENKLTPVSISGTFGAAPDIADEGEYMNVLVYPATLPSCNYQYRCYYALYDNSPPTINPSTPSTYYGFIDSKSNPIRIPKLAVFGTNKLSVYVCYTDISGILLSSNSSASNSSAMQESLSRVANVALNGANLYIADGNIMNVRYIDDSVISLGRMFRLDYAITTDSNASWNTANHAIWGLSNVVSLFNNSPSFNIQKDFNVSTVNMTTLASAYYLHIRIACLGANGISQFAVPSLSNSLSLLGYSFIGGQSQFVDELLNQIIARTQTTEGIKLERQS